MAVKDEKQMKKDFQSTFFKNRVKALISLIDSILSDSLICKDTIRVALLVLDNLSKL